MRKLIQSGTIVNEGRSFIGSLIIEDDCIIEIIENNETPRGEFDEIVNATGCFVLPGVIDDHVHFREPGDEHKETIETGSQAAAAGGERGQIVSCEGKWASGTSSQRGRGERRKVEERSREKRNTVQDF